MTPFALACSLGDLNTVRALSGDRDAAVTAARQEGRGHVLHGKWMIGVGPAAVVKSYGGHTPLTLAVRQRSFSLCCRLVSGCSVFRFRLATVTLTS